MKSASIKDPSLIEQGCLQVKERGLKIEELVVMTGMSKSSIWRAVRYGNLPHPYRVGKRLSRWKESEILSWMNEWEKVSG